MINLVPWNKRPLENGDVPVAIISLPDAIHRRNTLIERGLTPSLVNGFWPACDMRSLPDSELQCYRQYLDIVNLYGRAAISAELGCFFSHSAIIKWLAEQKNVSQVVVFEDDIVPGFSSHLDTLRNLAEAFSEYAGSSEAFICHLGPKSGQWRSAFTRRISKRGYNIPNLDLFDLVDKKTGLWRAHAYVINKEAARRYTKLAEKSGFLADDWRFIIDQTMSRMILTHPPLFSQDEDIDSTIDPENMRETAAEETDIRKGFGCIYLLKVKIAIQKGCRAFKFGVRACLVKIFRSLPRKKLYQ